MEEAEGHRLALQTLMAKHGVSPFTTMATALISLPGAMSGEGGARAARSRRPRAVVRLKAAAMAVWEDWPWQEGPGGDGRTGRFSIGGM
eukprot:scaffold12665_cov107-Isochrysis_galbana.AAC.1